MTVVSYRNVLYEMNKIIRSSRQMQNFENDFLFIPSIDICQFQLHISLHILYLCITNQILKMGLVWNPEHGAIYWWNREQILNVLLGALVKYSLLLK